MKLRFVAGITLLILIVSLSVGLYYKASYQDLNTEKEPLNKFVIGFLSSDLLDEQLKYFEKQLDSSNIIIAATCEEPFSYSFSSTSQQVSVTHVFQGENIKVGDTIDVVRSNSSIYLEEEYYIEGNPSINMDFVNEMVPGKTYLLFLDRKLDIPNNSKIYMQSDDFILAPIFCYETIKNTPCVSITTNGSNFVKYEDVKHNEFFLDSESGIKKMKQFKEKLLANYAYE